MKKILFVINHMNIGGIQKANVIVVYGHKMSMIIPWLSRLKAKKI